MLFLMIFIAVFPTFFYGQEIVSTCNIPAVQKGQETSITCNFSDDVSKREKAVVVKHFVAGKAEMVVACQWENGTVECRVRPTYAIDGSITNTLRVRIPNATEDHIGNYACYVIQEKEMFSECTFNLTVIESVCEASAIDQRKCATITCKFNQDLSQDHYEIAVKHFVRDKDENVMLCQWANGKEDCHVRPTYKFYGQISNQFTIEIPHVTQDHNGQYVCFVPSAGKEHFKSCMLGTQDQFTTTTIIYEELCANCTLGNLTETERSSFEWFMILIPSTIIGLVILLIVIRRKKCLQQPSARHSESTRDCGKVNLLNNPDDMSSSL